MMRPKLETVGKCDEPGKYTEFNGIYPQIHEHEEKRGIKGML